MINFRLVGRSGTQPAKVSDAGELACSPLSYSSPVVGELGTANVAVNLVKPRTGFRIAITDVAIYGNRNIGANDATVEIYEASSISSTTVSKQIFKFEVIKQSSVVIPSLKLITNEGVWINAKTDDDDVFIFMGAHYVPASIDTGLLID